MLSRIPIGIRGLLATNRAYLGQRPWREPVHHRVTSPRYSSTVSSTEYTTSSKNTACKNTESKNTVSKKEAGKSSGKGTAKTTKLPPDHREIGVQQELFTTSPYSPGSPLFLPHGTRIFNRLVEFLRKQYAYYGFEEVLTPIIYKKSLWEKSGHWQHYADDMYAVTSRSRTKPAETTEKTGGTLERTKTTETKDLEDKPCCSEHDETTSPNADTDADTDETAEYGLKPMNCPGHCLLFASQTRSYRDLPVRYADFSPLHRNEISGALTGLTRVRRLHQDDGHIFCRPTQVEAEISKTLEFVRVVYRILRLDQSDGTSGFRLALSTRPEVEYMGDLEEWERAETALRRALDASGLPWSVKAGDGAFYGPKIDIILCDSDGKEHQTATIQLDFQLPKRFDLEYLAPAPEREAQGLTTTDPEALARIGPVRPVMIHRAVLGSVERLLALLIEKFGAGNEGDAWPFWLNPRQAIVVTVNDAPEVMSWARTVRDVIEGHDETARQAFLQPQPHGVSSERRLRQPTGLRVEVDTRAETVGKKVREAHAKGYGLVLVVGPDDVRQASVTVTGPDLPEEAKNDGRGKRARMQPEALRDLMKDLLDTFQ